MEIVKKHPNTPAGLLAARREFDEVLRNQLPKTFDANAYNIFSTTTQSVRGSINSLINESVPKAFVKKRLKEQHNLFSAIDMLAPKAAKDISSGFGRLYQDVGRVIGMKMDLNRAVAVVAGASAFGVSGPLFLGFTGGLALGGTVTGLGILANSPHMKKALGTILKYTNEAIQTSTNPKMLKELRVHRAFVQDLLQSFPTEPTNNTQGSNNATKW